MNTEEVDEVRRAALALQLVQVTKNSGRSDSDRDEEGWCLASVGAKWIHLSQGRRKLRFEMDGGEQAGDVIEYELDPDDLVRIQRYATAAKAARKPQGRS